jgi:hypothetical protein
MRTRQATATGRTWRSPWTTSPSRNARPGRRAAPRAMPFARGRGRQATSSARLGGFPTGGRRPLPRTKQASARSPMEFAHGLLGAVGKNKASKGSRKTPALLAVLGGLGAAGAAALKRRQSRKEQSGISSSEPAHETEPARAEAA